MNVRLYVNGGELFAVSFKGLSLWPYEEFLKVPRDVRPADGTPNQKLGVLDEGVGVVIGIGELVFKIGKDWMCVCSVDITLFEDGKAGLKAAAWTHMLQGVQDLTIGAVLLQNTSFILHRNVVKGFKAHSLLLILVITGIKFDNTAANSL